MVKRSLAKLLAREFATSTNIIANLSANAVAAIAYLVAIPLYMPYLGIEAFGLVGLFTALQTILTVLDLGLSVALNRELALRHNDLARAPEMLVIIRKIERVYWLIAFLIGASFALGSASFARYLNPVALSTEAITESVVLMGIALALHFPIALYSGGLYGVHRQALVSAVFVLFALLRSLGAVAALAWYSATPQAFFAWQAICTGLHAFLLAILLRLSVSREGSDDLRGQPVAMKAIWRFSAGIGLITVLAVLVMQIDKFVLARMLSLESFGYYSLAVVISASVQRLVQPVFQAYFPKLSGLSQNANGSGIANAYHEGSQVMAVLVLPICAVIAFFSREVVMLWQQSAETADRTSLIVSLLVAGSALNAMLSLPYALQLAHGWTRLQVIALTASAATTIPLTILLTMRYGGEGAAFVWLLFNAGFLAATVPYMHRRLLKGEGRRWFSHSFAMPFAAACGAGIASRLLFIESGSTISTLVQLAAAYAIAFIAVAVASGFVRSRVLGTLTKN